MGLLLVLVLQCINKCQFLCIRILLSRFQPISMCTFHLNHRFAEMQTLNCANYFGINFEHRLIKWSACWCLVPLFRLFTSQYVCAANEFGEKITAHKRRGNMLPVCCIPITLCARILSAKDLVTSLRIIYHKPLHLHSTVFVINGLCNLHYQNNW